MKKTCVCIEFEFLYSKMLHEGVIIHEFLEKAK